MSAVVLQGGKILVSGGVSFELPTPPTQAATPVIGPPSAGTYTTAQSVPISDTTPGASIFYTVDGTTPIPVTNILTQPIINGIAGNLWVHGGTPPGNPPTGQLGLISEQANPQTGNGSFQVNPWGAGAYTGFTPVTPSTAQLSYAATGTSSTAQAEGGTIGVYIQTVDLPGQPANSKMMITAQKIFANQVIWADSGSVLNGSMMLQIPTATGGSTNFLNVNHQFYLTANPNLGFTFNADIFHLGQNAPNNIVITQDLGATNTYIINLPIGETVSNPYMTSVAGIYSQAIVSSFTNYAWAISYAQFQAALQLAQTQLGPITGWSTNPGDWTMTEMHVNAEIHYQSGVSDGTLGWSMKNWNVNLSEAVATSSLPYTGTITVPSTTQIQAIATAPGFTQSAVASATYTISAPASQYKWNPGFYMENTAYLYDTTFSAAISDINTYANGFNAASQGYAMNLQWIENATLLSNPTLSQSIINTQYPNLVRIDQILAYLQYKTPGKRLVVYLNSVHTGLNLTAAVIQSTNFATSGFIPGWIASCGGSLTVPNTYGSTSTTTYPIAPIYSGSSYYGVLLYILNGTTNFEFTLPSFQNPGVAQAFINYVQCATTIRQMGSTATAYASGTTYAQGAFVTSGSSTYMSLVNSNTNNPPASSPSAWCVFAYAGQTLDNCPLIEFIGSNDEYSVSVTSSQNVSGLTVNPPPYISATVDQPTPTIWANAMKNIQTKVCGFMQQTEFANCYTFGFSGDGNDTPPAMAARINNNISGTGLSVIPNSALSGADTFGADWVGSNPWANPAKQGYVGIANATFGGSGALNPATVPSVQGVMDNVAQVQASDYNSRLPTGVTGYTAAAVNAIVASGQVMGAGRYVFQSGDSQTFGTTAWTTYVYNALVALGTFWNTTRPSNLGAAASLLVTTGPLAATAGFPLVQALQVVQGTAPYTWALVSQTGGNGATLSSSGLLTVGSPVATGTIVVSVTDANSLTSGNVTIALNVTAVSGTLAISSPTSLPTATNGGAYFYKLAATGGRPPYAWYVGPSFQQTVGGYTGTSGTVWLMQSSYDSGFIQAAVTGSGTDSVPVTVVDSLGAIKSATLSITINSTLAFQGISLDQTTGYFATGMVNNLYAAGGYGATVSAAGGTAPYTYSLISGGPPGLTLNGTTGTWQGTPSQAGVYSAIQIQVNDNASHTATATFSMTILANQNVAIPSWNTGATKCFFQQSGQFYDPGGAPFRLRGFDRVHYNNGSDSAAFVASRASCVRFELYQADNNESTQAGYVQSQHINNNQFPVVMRYTDSQGNSSTGSATIGIPTVSNTQHAGGLGLMVHDWIVNSSLWLPIQGDIGLNIANEWGPTNNVNFLHAYQATQGAISGMTTTTLTLSTVSATHPFANSVALQYVYISSAGGVSNQLCLVTAVGGSSGAWTITGTFPSGWTSGGTCWGGAVGMLRAAGYLCPLFIDSGNSGQDTNDFLNYAAEILASDPIQNCVFSYHLYGATTNVACPITSITTGGSTTVHYTGPAWMSAGYNNNPFDTFEYNGDFLGKGVVYGAGGVTGLNTNVGTLSNQAGTQPNWSASLTVASSGTYTSGGWILDAYHYKLVLANLAALQSQGVCICVLEFGPATPPLTVGAGSNTLVTAGQVIRACEANGIGWAYWAMDDGSTTSPTNNGYTATLLAGTYTGLASQLSYSGLEVMRNPIYGVTVLSAPPSWFL